MNCMFDAPCKRAMVVGERDKWKVELANLAAANFSIIVLVIAAAIICRAAASKNLQKGLQCRPPHSPTPPQPTQKGILEGLEQSTQLSQRNHSSPCKPSQSQSHPTHFPHPFGYHPHSFPSENIQAPASNSIVLKYSNCCIGSSRVFAARFLQ